MLWRCAITVLVSLLALQTFYLFASLRTYMWIPLLAALRKRLRPQQELQEETQESAEGGTSLSVWGSKLHLCFLRFAPPFFFVPLFLTWQIPRRSCFDSVWEALRDKVKKKKEKKKAPCSSLTSTIQTVNNTKTILVKFYVLSWKNTFFTIIILFLDSTKVHVAEHFPLPPQTISLHMKLQ